MKRPDDKQAPRVGADRATAPPRRVPPPPRAGPHDAAPMRPDLWSRTADLWFRTVARDQQFRCPACSYDLRGLPAPGGSFRCPECGTLAARCNALARQDATTWWGRWRHHVLVITLLAVLLVPLVLLVPDGFTYEVVVSIVMLMILAYFAHRLSNANHRLSRRLPGLGYRERATAGVDRALSEALHTSQDEPRPSADEAPGERRRA